MPLGLGLCVWLCVTPFVFLLVAPWAGLRAAVVLALALLPVIALACRKLCAGSHVPRRPSAARPEP
jgi:hypothetical protein